MSGIVGTSHSKSKVIGKSQDTVKKWVAYSGTSEAIKSDFGISTIGDSGTGIYQINFDGNMPDALYSTVFGDNSWGTGWIATQTTSSVKLWTYQYHIPGYYESSYVSIIIVGN